MRYKMVITKSPVTKPLAETFAVMMVDILKVCGISRRYLRRGMFRKFLEISSDLGTYLHNIWSSDSELAGILEHFQKLANEEIAAGVAQLHIMMAESNKHLNRINSNIFGGRTTLKERCLTNRSNERGIAVAANSVVAYFKARDSW